MLQQVPSRFRYHARHLRILNGFSFRWHCRTINAQSARPRIVCRDGVQRWDVLETLGHLHQLLHDASLSTFSAVSGSPGPAAAIALPLRWDESADDEEEITRGLTCVVSGENSRVMVI